VSPADTDQRQRFLFPDTDIRGEVLRLEASLAPVVQARDYPDGVATLLGEAMAACALLSGTLKFQGRLSLQAQGSGPVSLLLAESSHDGGLRGLCRWRGSLSGLMQPCMTTLLGEGTLAISIRPDQGLQYQGLVSLATDSLASCLENYFEQSEQLPTRLWLAAGNGRAAGFMLQRLPDRIARPEDNAHCWETLTTLAATLTTEELLGLPADALLHRLFHQTPPALTRPAPLFFACTCSRARVAETLKALGAAELESILDELGKAEVICDFCGQAEVFDPVDLGLLIHAARTAAY